MKSLTPLLTLLFALTAVADDCRPWTWTWDVNAKRADPTEVGAFAAAASSSSTSGLKSSSSSISSLTSSSSSTSTSKSSSSSSSGKGAVTSTSSTSSMPEVTRAPGRDSPVKPGEINCRNWGETYDGVGYWSCNQLAKDYGITIDKFWELNPQLAPDCEGIKEYTQYCVAGFIEPLRSTDGFCGPKHNNATCVGSDFGQCCNADTWKCGGTETDCSPGICYEGLCPGHKVYTTDGTCGYAYDYSSCTGKWGDCCNMEGHCGTGADFCGNGKCQLGNCTEWSV